MTTERSGPAEENVHQRNYRIDVKRCLWRACDGELAEIAYYERNNWVTIELQCNRCRRKFTMKVET